MSAAVAESDVAECRPRVRQLVLCGDAHFAESPA